MRATIIIVCVCIVVIVILVATSLWFRKRKTMKEKECCKDQQPPITLRDIDMWKDFSEARTIETIGVIGPYFPLTSEQGKGTDKVVAFDRVVTEAESLYLIMKTKPHLRPSLVIGPNGDKVLSKTRSSETTYIEKGSSPWIKHLEQRFASILQTTPDKLEPMQIAHYTKGKKFEPHLDTLDHVGPPGQRMSTLLIYLNTLPPEEDGGRTIFVKFNAGLKPKCGTGLAWNNVDPTTGKIDRDMWHEGEVLKDEDSEKYILTIWSRKKKWQ